MSDGAGLVVATAAHAPAMAAIHAASYPPRERWGADAMALQLGLPGAFGLIDPQGGLILARQIADEAEILTLAVAPGLRCQGRGGRLLSAAISEATLRGAAAMFLEVSESNNAAKQLYCNHGFVTVGFRRHYYPDGSNADVMRRPLTYGAAADA